MTRAAPQAQQSPPSESTQSSEAENATARDCENGLLERMKTSYRIKTISTPKPAPQARAMTTRSRQTRRNQTDASLIIPMSRQEEKEEKSSEPKKSVLVPIADGSEEIETSCITETLARFGARVVVASVMADNRLACTMSRGLKVIADTTIEEAVTEEWDLIVLPGGMPGARFLRQSNVLIHLLDRQKEKNKLIGAICTSPVVVLATAGLVEDGATCYPARILRERIKDASDEDVVVQDKIITSQGPGTSLLFALRLGEELYGKEKADEIAREMLVDRGGVPSYTVRLLPSDPVTSAKAKNGKVGRKRTLEKVNNNVPPVTTKVCKKSKNTVCKKSKNTSSLPILPGKDAAKTLKEGDLFRDIVWARLLKLGWKYEAGTRKVDKFYIPPGITRGPGATNRKDYFDSRPGVLKYLQYHGGEGRKVYDFYMECLSVGRELLRNRQLHKDFTADFLENETKRRKGGHDLFDHIVWQRLLKLGWRCEQDNTSKKLNFVYVPPGEVGGKSQWTLGKHYFESKDHVLDFLDHSEECGNKDSVSKIRELYHACNTFQKEYIAAEGKAGKDLTSEWIETETKKRKPYLASY